MDVTTKFYYKNSYGTIEFARNSPFWISELEGVSAVDVDIAESRGSRQIGSTISAQSVQPRTVSVNGCLFDPVRANREQLLRVVAPQVPATFVMMDANESWFLNVVPQRTPEIEEGDTLEHFQMQLYAAYPYWRTTAATASVVSGIQKKFRFPFFTGGTWALSEFSGDYYTTVNNKGNVPIDVRVHLTARAEVKNPQIYHVDTGKLLTIKHTLTPGEKIIVSTEYGEKGVTLIKADGTADKSLKYLSVDSDLTFQLVPGDNLIRTDAEQGREGLNAMIEAREGVKSGV